MGSGLWGKLLKWTANSNPFPSVIRQAAAAGYQVSSRVLLAGWRLGRQMAEALAAYSGLGAEGMVARDLIPRLRTIPQAYAVHATLHFYDSETRQWSRRGQWIDFDHNPSKREIQDAMKREALRWNTRYPELTLPEHGPTFRNVEVDQIFKRTP